MTVQNSLLGYMSLCVFLGPTAVANGITTSTPEKGIGSFLGEMSGAVHNVSFIERLMES